MACSAEPIHLVESSASVNSCYYHPTCTKTTGCTSVIRIWKWAIYCRPLETNWWIKEALKTAGNSDANIIQMLVPEQRQEKLYVGV